ncbi:MAG TPA: CoA ester lyase [Candidatus Acidoferrum sp.]|nr:CoA ester lyase [Candidatus Acidoferrum sp.]
MTVRPRRSVLFMPGSNARAMEKARSLPADAVIFDLEDAVAPDAKEQARAQAVAAVRAGGYGRREVIVRVNAGTTPWSRDDLAAVAASGADAVLLPKVESPDTVHDALGVLAAHGAPAGLSLWCMLETPRGILNAASIATASPRVTALVMGTSDLTKDLHARHTRDRVPLLMSLELCVLAARAAGIAALDGVHLDLADDAGFEAACRQAADLGFDGKTLIHPKTIAKANEVFAPAPADVEWSRRVIAAHAEAVAQARGLVVLDGRLIENLHVEEAQRIVALAEAIEALASE